MNNHLRSIRDSYYLFKCMLLICVIAIMSFGCATRHTIEDISGEQAVYQFQVIRSDIKGPIIHWVEKPRHIETAIRLELQLEGCKKINIYANRHPDSPIKLANNPRGIVPLDFTSKAEELASWSKISSSDCAILITLGTIREDLFTGISISKHNGVIHRHRTVLQGSLNARPSQAGWLAFAGIYDYIYSPFYVLGGVVGASSREPSQPVSVLFTFPDGGSVKTELTKTEVESLLGEHYPNVLAVPMHPLQHVRAWTRAAIAKLELEFSEETSGHIAHDEWIPDSIDLKMVNGYWGVWEYTLNEHGSYQTDLAEPVTDSHIIRFTLGE